jgi:Family of unknown function (DUF6599)
MIRNTLRIIMLFIMIANMLVFLNCSGAGEDTDDMNLGALFPAGMGIWKAVGEFEIYDYDGIFKYIDGAGEVYRMYDYHELWVRHYTGDNLPRITAEVFDMGKSEDAYGIFIHSWRETKGIGQGYSLSGDILCFWQDKFLVNVYSEKSTPDTKLAIRDIAQKISDAIDVTGPKPAIIKYLPQDKIMDGSLKYFHLHTSLNYHYYLSPDNILLLNKETDIALAQYNEAETYLVCIHYPDPDKAELARLNFLEGYIPEAGELGAFEVQENEWVVTELQGEFLIIVFDASSLETSHELINKCREKLPD